MLEIDTRRFFLKSKKIWFADYPYDIRGYTYITFWECKNKVDMAGFRREEHTTLVIDLTKDLDAIWDNMDKKSCRYGIRRARRDGVIVKTNQNFSEFYEINMSFRRKKGLDSGSSYHPKFMKKYGTLFTAEFNGNVIAGQFYLEDQNNIRWLVGASKRLEIDRDKTAAMGYANRLLVWEAIEYAKAKGIREFDMGGYYTGGDTNDPRYTISLFKKDFGGELTTHYIYHKDYSRILQATRFLLRRGR